MINRPLGRQELKKMIFVGDIALPYKGAVKWDGIPEQFLKKNWFGNLEGAIVKGENEDIAKRIVFNDKEAVSHLVSEFSYKGFALANNHIFDTGDYHSTVGYLDQQKIPFCGIGESLFSSKKPLVLEEHGQTIVILNFGWEVIQCEVTLGDHLGVNPLRKEHVMDSVRDAVKTYRGAKIIAFMHWSYELEAEPQPFERDLARHLIDMGVTAVLGCHPHRIGGFEMYRGKPIVYSLGNWLFKQRYYRQGKSQFPEFCSEQLAFEIDFESDNFFFHFFKYDKEESRIDYICTEEGDSTKMQKYTPFKDLSPEDYIKWYRKNRYHKGKGLPVYYWEDSRAVTNLKNQINKMRDCMVQFYLKLR